MRRALALGFFAVFAVLLISCRRTESSPDYLSAPVDAAFKYLADEHGVVAPRGKLALLEQRVDEQGALHLRFQQVHASIPVYGSNVIVHLNPDLTGRLVTGSLISMAQDTDTKPDLTAESARTTAQEQSCADTTGVPELVYWLNARHEPVLAWRVPSKRALLSCDVFVDANEYRTLGIINRSPNGK